MSEVTIHNKELMTEARRSLSSNWGLAIGTLIVFYFVAIASFILPFGIILLGGPLALGWSIFSLKLARDQQAKTGNIFDGFNNFGTALGAYWLMILGIMVGMLFFIVPGVILAYGWSQTMFIIADDPKITATDALRKSWKLMNGHKMDYFILGLRFIPWYILSWFTLFIGMLWLIPYMQVTYANFYNELIGYHLAEESDIIDDDIIKHIID